MSKLVHPPPDETVRARSLAKYRKRAARYDRTCGPTWPIRERAIAALNLQPGQAVIYHAWEPYQFENWSSSQTVVAGAFKPLHMLGGYGHLSFRPIHGQPSHTPRAQKVEIEKVLS